VCLGAHGDKSTIVFDAMEMLSCHNCIVFYNPEQKATKNLNKTLSDRVLQQIVMKLHIFSKKENHGLATTLLLFWLSASVCCWPGAHLFIVLFSSSR
jgi:hypothetical protein